VPGSANDGRGRGLARGLTFLLFLLLEDTASLNFISFLSSSSSHS